MNGSKTTTYFKLESCTCQGYPISANLFTLVIETFFTLAKSNTNIQGIKVYGMNFYLMLMQMTVLFF